MFHPVSARQAVTAAVFGAIASFPVAGGANAAGLPPILQQSVKTGRGLAINGDGSIVVGYQSNVAPTRAFRWLRGVGGLEATTPPLDLSPFVNSSRVTGISDDGSIMVGWGAVLDPLTNQSSIRAMTWNSSGMISRLPELPQTGISYAYDVSGDGSTIVGSLHVGQFTAVYWRGGQAYAIASNASAVAVNANGRIVGGNLASHAFRWTWGGVTEGVGTLQMLNDPAGTILSDVTDMSDDGSTLVGYYVVPNVGRSSFIWNASTGTMTELGLLPQGPNMTTAPTRADAKAISGDGRIVVGLANIGNYAPGVVVFWRAVRWLASDPTKIQTVEEWLRDNGLTIADGLTIGAYGVNDDGSVVVGDLQNGMAFLARVAPGRTGLLTMDNYASSLATASGMIDNFLPWSDDDALARSNLLGPGMTELGSDMASGGGAGDFALPAIDRFGIGYGLDEGLTVRLSGGRTWLDATVGSAVDARGEGWIIRPEMTVKGPAGSEITLGAFGALGEERISRNYDNAGHADMSAGTAAAETFGARLRISFPDASEIGGVSLSPFIDAEARLARRADYTEASGSFPAKFESRNVLAGRLRLGLDLAAPLGDRLDLVARAEVIGQAIRYEASAGQILGLSTFDLPQQDSRGLSVDATLGLRRETGFGSIALTGTVRRQEEGGAGYSAGISFRQVF